MTTLQKDILFTPEVVSGTGQIGHRPEGLCQIVVYVNLTDGFFALKNWKDLVLEHQ